jgi:MFS transporter, FHS family, glucose/mannose:H+ symporter
LPRLKYYTLAAFFIIGIATLLLGQILPTLSARLHLTDAKAGTLFLAQFSGSLLGNFVSTYVAKRHGFTYTALLGLLLMILGLPGINAAQFEFCWLGILIYGFGLGVAIPSINMLTIETTEARLQASAVNLINFSWGVGAICSQPFVAALTRDGDLIRVTVLLIGSLIVLAVLFFWAARGLQAKSRPSEEQGLPETRIWRRPAAWLFVAFGFFVVSIEGGLGGWLTTYTEYLNNAGLQTFNLTVVYFSFFVLGRGIASIVSRRVSDNNLILFCSVTLLVGIVLLVFNEAFVPGAAVAGLGSSAIFPTHMARFARVFGESANLQAAPIFIAGTSGAAAVSTLVGLVSSAFGGLRYGILVVLVSGVSIIILHFLIASVFAKEQAADI